MALHNQPTDPAENKPEANIVHLPGDDYMKLLAHVETCIESHLRRRTGIAESAQLILEPLLELISAIRFRDTETAITARLDKAIAVMEELDTVAKELVAGAEAQLKEVIEEHEKAPTTHASASTGTESVISFEDIAAEITRRDREREIRMERQELLEDELETKKSLLKIELSVLAAHPDDSPKTEKAVKALKAEIKKLEADRDRLIQTNSDSDAKMAKLGAFREALILVRKGIPPDIFGEKFTVSE